MTLSSLLFHNDRPALTVLHCTDFRPPVVQPDESFAWSDVAVVHQHDDQFSFGAHDHLQGPLTLNEAASTSCTSKSPVTSGVSSVASLASISTSSSYMDIDLPTPKKSVSFAENLEVCEFNIVIGDHPYCKDSLALSLGWEHAEPITTNLDEYEKERSPYRRRGDFLRMSFFERKNVLRRIGGYSEADLRGGQNNLHHSRPSAYTDLSRMR